MDNIKITAVLLDEARLLQQIGKQTFSETFAATNSEQSMATYLAESFGLEKLCAELENKESQFYFAKINGDVVAYIKLNTGNAQTETVNEHALEIERIYVLAAYQGKNVGQLLYNKAIEVASQIKAEYVWLGVWEENHKAIRFYEKNGFAAFDKHIFNLGGDKQTDLMMKKVLKG